MTDAGRWRSGRLLRRAGTCLTAVAAPRRLAKRNRQLADDLRRTLQREREARLAAESAGAAKNEFLALIAHELRQPLHASLAALRLMETRCSRSQGVHARAVVERQLTLMNRLVEELVHAARIVSGRVELRLAATDLAAVLHTTAEAVRPLMDEQSHAFTLDLPANALVVPADSDRLLQVVMNLLSNAAKYTDPGGRIVLGLAREADHAVIRVADNGRGIAPDEQPRVFELFTRGSDRAHGFGVGLAVARTIVEMHGGRIEVRSAGRGLGSEFRVHLPLHTRERAAQPDPAGRLELDPGV
jgi:signal transduction histidine kinase